MTVDELRQTDWIIMEAVVGSHSFGLATEKSDRDVRGVFVLPMEDRISYGAFDQVADEKNDTVYWELAKFLKLLRDANPSALEFLNSPDGCILSGKDYFDTIPKDMWLTCKCRSTFVNYAKDQLHRAYGLNKKVFKPCPKEHPRVLDYCYVVDGNRAVPFRDWLKERKGDIVPTGYPNDQKSYALAAIDHVTDTYALYYEHLLLDQVEMAAPEHEWRWAYGVVADEEKSCDIQLCSIPQGLYPVATLFFNKNAYSHDCAEHTKYWKWVEDRNEERYAGTIAHGKGYDAKNVMHCIRLLMTAKDIAEKGVVTVDRSADREFLFRIKRGEFEYDEVVKMGNELCEAVERAFDASTRLMPEVTCRDTDRLLHWMLASLPDKFNRLIISEMDFDDDEADT